MKAFKTVISLFLIVSMLSCFAVPAFAAEEELSLDDIRREVVKQVYGLIPDHWDKEYDSWAMSDIFPRYSIGNTSGDLHKDDTYICFLFKDGVAVSKVEAYMLDAFTLPQAFLFQLNGDYYPIYPAVDDAFYKNTPIAFVGNYLVTEDSFELLEETAFGPVKEPSFKREDFPVSAEQLTEPTILRFADYRKDKENLTFYRFGWNEIDGDRYYIKSDGTFVKRPTTIDGVRYQFDKNGACQGTYTGFTSSSKGRRYWKDGKLVKNKWIRVKGERKYYAGADGYFVTGTATIDGAEYTFAEDGAVLRINAPQM
ncbi:MAG: hypothetical protein NC084_03300 [Bacteroides sp.]|nr:hypothetical protein [Eubacterium sp.]MCM1417566.1 hypothetical protein [Roseburia sp.]MCM1461723.1 hypothetical protein [Bacteroides sp.]